MEAETTVISSDTMIHNILDRLRLNRLHQTQGLDRILVQLDPSLRSLQS